MPLGVLEMYTGPCEKGSNPVFSTGIGSSPQLGLFVSVVAYVYSTVEPSSASTVICESAQERGDHRAIH